MMCRRCGSFRIMRMTLREIVRDAVQLQAPVDELRKVRRVAATFGRSTYSVMCDDCGEFELEILANLRTRFT